MAPVGASHPQQALPRPGLVELIVPGLTQPAIRASVFRNGSVCAAGYVIVAVLINHIRRVLVPWLCQFLWRSALDDMKTARSSPHYSIQQSLDLDAEAVLFYSIVQLYALTKAYGSLRKRLQQDAGQKNSKSLDVFRVLYLVFALLSAEMAYNQSCWAVARGYAYARLLVWGGDAEMVFLRQVLRAKWYRLPPQAGLALVWLRTCVTPRAMCAANAALRGRLTALVFLVGVCYWTAFLVRYSNKYFMLLEMRGMLITFAWMIMGLGYVLGVSIQRWWKSWSSQGGEEKPSRNHDQVKKMRVRHAD